jgi:two-component sensor histidine kinase
MACLSGAAVNVTLNRATSSIIITVIDEGEGMMEAALSETRGLGVGLAIMNSQTERLEIESDATGTMVTLRFSAPHTG